MNLKDFREEVLKRDNSDFLNSLKISISYPHLKYSTELIGITNVYQFVLNQVKGWNGYETITPTLNESKTFFENIKNEILGTVPYFEIELQHQFISKWNYLIKDVLEKSKIYGGKSIFLYETPESKFLNNLSSRPPNFLQGAEEYLSEEKIPSLHEKEYLNGVMASYEFKNQDYSEIIQRRNQEKTSLSQIRTSYQSHLSEAELHLNDYLVRTKESLTEHFTNIDELRKEKKKVFEDWFSETSEKFETFNTNSTESITKNEELYREKLRLEAPAEYWKKRGVKLKAEAQIFLTWLISLIIFSAIGLFILLFQIPDGMLLKVFDDKTTAIKWSIILVTMLSLLAFGIKILARLTFSSYHLSRDSEEREQLTHFYLALKQDASVTDSDRQLILQSLFSRADSGLLKEDSSPTMPSSIVEKYVNK
jgi:hypothetical protein